MKAYRIPPLIMDIVRAALTSLDGMDFTRAGPCPAGGSKLLTGHDKKRKKFAVLLDEDGKERSVIVIVKRFLCRECGRLCYADEPFYPSSRIGSPVVDLYMSLSAIMPPSRAAGVIAAMGITVNRTTWRNYRKRSASDIPVVDVFGMRLPLCIITLSDIAIRDQQDPIAVIHACRNPSGKNPPGKS